MQSIIFVFLFYLKVLFTHGVSFHPAAENPNANGDS